MGRIYAGIVACTDYPCRSLLHYLSASLTIDCKMPLQHVTLNVTLMSTFIIIIKLLVLLPAVWSRTRSFTAEQYWHCVVAAIQADVTTRKFIHVQWTVKLIIPVSNKSVMFMTTAILVIRQLKIARHHLMPIQQHAYNGLAHPAHNSIFTETDSSHHTVVCLDVFPMPTSVQAGAAGCRADVGTG